MTWRNLLTPNLEKYMRSRNNSEIGSFQGGASLIQNNLVQISNNKQFHKRQISALSIDFTNSEDANRQMSSQLLKNICGNESQNEDTSCFQNKGKGDDIKGALHKQESCNNQQNHIQTNKASGCQSKLQQIQNEMKELKLKMKGTNLNKMASQQKQNSNLTEKQNRNNVKTLPSAFILQDMDVEEEQLHMQLFQNNKQQDNQTTQQPKRESRNSRVAQSYDLSGMQKVIQNNSNQMINLKQTVSNQAQQLQVMQQFMSKQNIPQRQQQQDSQQLQMSAEDTFGGGTMIAIKNDSYGMQENAIVEELQRILQQKENEIQQFNLNKVRFTENVNKLLLKLKRECKENTNNHRKECELKEIINHKLKLMKQFKNCKDQFSFEAKPSQTIFAASPVLNLNMNLQNGSTKNQSNFNSYSNFNSSTFNNNKNFLLQSGSEMSLTTKEKEKDSKIQTISASTRDSLNKHLSNVQSRSHVQGNEKVVSIQEFFGDDDDNFNEDNDDNNEHAYIKSNGKRDDGKMLNQQHNQQNQKMSQLQKEKPLYPESIFSSNVGLFNLKLDHCQKQPTFLKTEQQNDTRFLQLR